MNTSSPLAKLTLSLCAALGIAGLAACGKQEAGTELGKGGSVVTGSAGPAGAKNAAKELMQCDAPVAVVSLVENKGGYVGIGRNGLPESPLPLVRVLKQQSGCFRIVDRNSGLESTVREQELKDKGILRADAQGNVKKGARHHGAIQRGAQPDLFRARRGPQHRWHFVDDWAGQNCRFCLASQV
jgi:curli biogenesis system outer membrane secretion channel CsgG